MTDQSPSPYSGPRWEDLIEMTDDEALAAIDAHIAETRSALAETTTAGEPEAAALSGRAGT